MFLVSLEKKNKGPNLMFQIVAAPKVSAIPPIGSVTVIEGEGVILECEFTGNQLPSITWSKEGGLPQDSIPICSRSSCLQLPKVKKRK